MGDDGQAFPPHLASIKAVLLLSLFPVLLLLFFWGWEFIKLDLYFGNADGSTFLYDGTINKAGYTWM